jgi:signal transduction histidine kinase/CheY-like chemotaxis protein
VIEISSEELIAAIVFSGFVYGMAIFSLSYYYRKLEFSYLLAGAVAMAFELVSQLFETIALMGQMPLLLEIAVCTRMVSAVCLLVCVYNLTDKKVSQGVLGAGFVMLIGVYITCLLWQPSEPIRWTLLEAPSALLLLYGVALLVRGRLFSPGYVAMMSLMAVHVVLRTLLPWVNEAQSMLSIGYFLDSVIVVLIASALVVICAEMMIKRIDDKDVKLSNIELENRRLEMQFAHAQKEESLGVLAGGIAHDFNNMLTSILGYTSLAMKKLPSDSEVRKDLYMVMSGARQATDLTSQMLTYTGKSAVEFDAIEISHVVDNMSGLINSIVPRKIRLVHKEARDLPKFRGDSVQLGQVLMNLVANAVDAIDNNIGKIEITTGLADVDMDLLRASLFSADLEPNAYVFVRVSDTGVGFDPGEVERIFDPFYSQKTQGKGLGLSSISGIVRQHKGFIHVNSLPGNGADFTVYFPIIAYKDVAGTSKGSVRMATAGIKGRVLLADDDPRIRSLIASILESDAYHLTSVEDGKEAVKRVSLEGADYDAFVLDCTMPKMSGPEVYREIRATGNNAPVILVSGYQQEQVISDISNDEHAYFMKKPFSVDELLETVNAAMAFSEKPVSRP